MRRLRTILSRILTILWLLSIGQVEAQQPPSSTASLLSPAGTEKAISIMQEAIESQKIQGAVLLVSKNGQIVLHRALGWRNVEDKIPMQVDTLFKMASNTKPVIATAVLQLAERRKLRLDDPVCLFIPSWSEGRNEKVTIRHLLNHTSGLRTPEIFIKPLIGPSDEHPDAPSLGLEVDRFAKIGVEHEPGTTYSYNNAGFQVLGRIIELASGKSIKQTLRDEIYTPLGMNDSFNYESDAPTERMGRVYSWKEGKRTVSWKPEDGPDWPIVRSSGGMISTASDYARFCQMYLDRGNSRGKQILAPESIREATRIQTGHTRTDHELATNPSFYGLGWSVDTHGIYSHSGSDGTAAWIDPERRLVVLVFTQSPGGPNPSRLFFESILAASDEGDRSLEEQLRPRLADLGYRIGDIPTGGTNAITDVAGVQVGHETVCIGDDIRTGVTAIQPHGGNVFLHKVPAAVHVANGFGKFVGLSQIEELGVLESPIVLTNTLSTFAAADALTQWSLLQPGCEKIQSVNPIVGECNDGGLNNIRKQAINSQHVFSALRKCRTGRVLEGCVGAGTGVRCMGWKSGIGTSSRKLPESSGGYTLGVLVQSNFGGSLTIAGVPVGKVLDTAAKKDEQNKQEHGSCMIVLATDAPLDSRRLKRIASRATLGLGAVGTTISHGSGDYVIAFSTSEDVRVPFKPSESVNKISLLRDEQLTPLFQAARDATEEAIIHSILRATTTSGYSGARIEAIEPSDVLRILSEHGRTPILP